MKYHQKKLNIKKIIYNNKPQLGHYDVNPFNYKSSKTIFYYRRKNINFFKGLKEIIKKN